MGIDSYKVEYIRTVVTMNISYVVCKKWGGVMKELFKERTSKFQSLVSLIVICAMLTLFVFALPEFFVSTAGRIFATAWASLAIIAFIAHVRRMSVSQLSYKRVAHFGVRNNVRTTRQQRMSRVMRG